MLELINRLDSLAFKIFVTDPNIAIANLQINMFTLYLLKILLVIKM